MGADRAILAGKERRSGAKRRGQSAFFDAILWLARTASPWRDLPPEPGSRKTVHCRFRRWTLAGALDNLFKALREDPDFEYALVDATICKAHADAGGAKGGLKLTQSAARKAA